MDGLAPSTDQASAHVDPQNPHEIGVRRFLGECTNIFDGPLLLLFGALRHGGDGIDVATRQDVDIALVVRCKGLVGCGRCVRSWFAVAAGGWGVV